MRLLVQARAFVKMRGEEVQKVQEKHSGHDPGKEQVPLTRTKTFSRRENEADGRRRKHHSGAEAKRNVIPLVWQLLDNEADYGSKKRSQA